MKIAGCHPLKKIGHLTPKTPPKDNYVKKTPQKKLTFCQILSKKDTRSFNSKPICKSFVVILKKSVFSCVLEVFYTVQLSNRKVLINSTMGFSAVLVCYYMYKFIAKDSKIIPLGYGSLHTIFLWLVGGCCVKLCAQEN